MLRRVLNKPLQAEEIKYTRDAWVKTIDTPVLPKPVHACCVGKTGKKSRLSNIEASDTEMMTFCKVETKLFDIQIEKCEKGGILIL